MKNETKKDLSSAGGDPVTALFVVLEARVRGRGEFTPQYAHARTKEKGYCHKAKPDLIRGRRFVPNNARGKRQKQGNKLQKEGSTATRGARP